MTTPEREARRAPAERAARTLAGPAYRRIKREWQWRRCGADLSLACGDPSGFPYAVTSHASPMLRQLQGLPMQLQHTKITNLRLAVAPLDGRVLRPGQRLSFWKFVGNPSAKRGFLDGVVLHDGVLRPRRRRRPVSAHEPHLLDDAAHPADRGGALAAYV